MKRSGNISRYRWMVFFTVVLVLSACRGTTNKHSGKRKVTDMAGRTMLVPDTIRRVYMSRVGCLELYAIDPELAVCRTCGVNKYSAVYLDSAYVALPYNDGIVGKTLMVEEIMKLNPDIIINCFTISEQSKDEADQLARRTGIPVFLIEMDIKDYPKAFDLLGKLLHREAQTDRMDAFVHTYLDTIASHTARMPDSAKVKVYYAVGDYGLHSIPAGSFRSQILEFAGARNVADVDIDVISDKGLNQISMEQILMWDPDMILCWSGNGINTYKSIVSDKAWLSLRAVKNGEVHQTPYVPYGWIGRPPSTNRILGAIWLAHMLYPDIFPYNMREVSREYFRIFYHHTVTDAELNEMLTPIPETLGKYINKKYRIN